MNLLNFEMLSRNCDVAIEFYRFLEFEDCLRLASVNEDLRTVFKRFIWRMEYRELKIYPDESGNGNYVVANGTDLNRIHLSQDAYRLFIALYASDVESVTLTAAQDIQPFRNVISLHCCLANYCIVPILKKFRDHLPALQNLQIRNCHLTNDYSLEEILPSLISIKSLKRLSIHFRYCPEIRFEQFYKIVLNLRLQVLELLSCKTPLEDIKLTNDGSLKVLKLTTPFDAPHWFSNSSTFFEIAANLLILEIKISSYEFTHENLQLLADICKNLQKLHLKQIKFSEIEDFVIPPTLQEISLHSCKGLSQKNLRQILRGPNQIHTFTSCFTSYQGPFEDFPMSLQLQSLTIDTLDDRPLRWSLYGQQFRAYFSPRSPQIDIEEVSHIPLASCKNLKILHLQPRCYVNARVLSNLKCLHTLKMWIPKCNWNLIADLLRITTLENLHLICNWNFSSKAPFAGFLTSVTTLKVENLLVHGLDFFLDLFSKNSQMKLIFYVESSCAIDKLKILFNHEKFPIMLRTIQYLGFTIDCSDLRRNFDKATQHCIEVWDSFESPQNEIILQRN
ncbi:uncharacterized protein LOC142240238 [Haematobia irritans]|uniref:uncharacterized protein LOC142240238 n=1 Tax=Haematobia irritans TaxID=7368 RepID=UPI003F50D467